MKRLRWITISFLFLFVIFMIYPFIANNIENMEDNSSSKFHIFISSNIDYEKIHLSRLIENIENINIPNNIVHIIIGGYDKESIEYINNIEIIRVPYRAFEFTPFTYIIKNPDKYDFDYAFFSHDSVTFGENFYNSILKYIHYMNNNNFDTMGIEPNAMSMNIGIYKKNVIFKNVDLINSITIYSNDKDKLFELKNRLVPVEDTILKSGNHYHNNDLYPEVTQYKDYNAEKKLVDLWKKYYKNIDFTKIQTNNGNIFSISSPINI